MKHKLSPVFYSLSLEMRKNLWQVFVEPLFGFTLPCFIKKKQPQKKKWMEYSEDPSRTLRGLGKTIDNQSIEEQMGYNLSNRSKHVQYISEKKWKFGLEGKVYSPNCDTNKMIIFALQVNQE